MCAVRQMVVQAPSRDQRCRVDDLQLRPHFVFGRRGLRILRPLSSVPIPVAETTFRVARVRVSAPPVLFFLTEVSPSLARTTKLDRHPSAPPVDSHSYRRSVAVSSTPTIPHAGHLAGDPLFYSSMAPLLGSGSSASHFCGLLHVSVSIMPIGRYRLDAPAGHHSFPEYIHPPWHFSHSNLHQIFNLLRM